MTKFVVTYGDPANPQTDVVRGGDASLTQIDSDGTRRVEVFGDGPADNPEVVYEMTVGAGGVLGYEEEDRGDD